MGGAFVAMLVSQQFYLTLPNCISTYCAAILLADLISAARVITNRPRVWSFTPLPFHSWL